MSGPDDQLAIDPALRGKVAVVTGAARGIGAALARELARSGAQVALVGLEPAELAAAADSCARLSHAKAYVADVTDSARMAAVATEVVADFGAADIVVANAGIAIGGPFADADPAEFDRVIEVNLLGSARTARAFLPALADSAGYFLQIASLAALGPAPFMTAYCASKSGVEAFAHVLRVEVAHLGVRVGVAYLTFVDTDMVRGADADEVLGEYRRQPRSWPVNRTVPLDAAVSRIVTGISRRSVHVYVPAWVRAVQWLPRGVLASAVNWREPAEVAMVTDQLRASRHTRLAPVGPGGRAGSAAAARSADTTDK